MSDRLLLLFCCFLISNTLLFAQQAPPSDLLITVPEGPKPWSSLDINHSDEQFQFAIVTDRTGGRRPGVFMKGIRKLNLLQPEFVMSVGDLIDGYTEDVPELERQWDEFDGFIDSLQMPFFYLPGNHDITNAVMDSLWQERYGPAYYHFVYKEVLFLCLNSEDQFRGAGRGSISDPQFEYIKKTLEENQEVRWTLVFMHQPLWLQKDPKRWPEVEALLAKREHSVFVGHVHHYVQYARNNGRYYTLATTGGGSPLRGPELGEFDHITWVTMTEEGPIMANLALDGIYSDDLVTEQGYDFIRRLTAGNPVRFSPLLVEGNTFEEAMVQTEIRNVEDRPLFVTLRPRFSFDYSFELPRDTLTVGPNSVEYIEWKLRSRRGFRKNADLSSQLVEVDLRYQQNGTSLTIPFSFRIAPQKRRSIPVISGEAPVIDGDLDDWESLPYSFGADDWNKIQVQWGIQRDDEFLYIAAKIKDNNVRVEAGKSPFDQDCFALLLNAEPLATSMKRRGEGRYRNSYALAITPQTDQVKESISNQAQYDLSVPTICKAANGGYVFEMAFPLSYIKERQGDQWQSLRLNLGVQDWNWDSDEKAFFFWQPEWSRKDNWLGSGLFFK